MVCEVLLHTEQADKYTVGKQAWRVCTGVATCPELLVQCDALCSFALGSLLWGA